MKKRNKKKYTYLLFVILLLSIGVGYAYLTTNLNITGTTTLKDNRWDIHLENVQVKSGSVSSPTPTIDTNKTTVSYSITLEKPGDFYEFTVDVVNAGTIDGMIDTVSNENNGGAYLDDLGVNAVLNGGFSFDDGLAILPNYILEAGETKTYKIRMEYKKDINNIQLLTDEVELNYTFSVNYVQADENAIHLDGDRYVGDYIGYSIVKLNEPIPFGTIAYATPEEAMAKTEGPYYAKHVLNSQNIVTESYSVLEVTPEMVLETPEMTVGTYEFRGGGNGIYYEQNKALAIQAFGSSHCTDYQTSIYCQAGSKNYNVTIYNNGNVGAGMNTVGQGCEEACKFFTDYSYCDKICY